VTSQIRPARPESLSAACSRTPVPPIPSGLDAALIDPRAAETQSLRNAYATLAAAFVARGVWIVALSQFSLAQEGDLAACEARKDLAVGLIDDARAAADALNH